MEVILISKPLRLKKKKSATLKTWYLKYRNIYSKLNVDYI